MPRCCRELFVPVSAFMAAANLHPGGDRGPLDLSPSNSTQAPPQQFQMPVHGVLVSGMSTSSLSPMERVGRLLARMVKNVWPPRMME